jgi:uncharacterized protein DUF4153
LIGIDGPIFGQYLEGQMLDNNQEISATESDNHRERESQLDILIYFVLPGLVQGLALYILNNLDEKAWNSPPIIAAMLFFIVAPLAYLFTTAKGRRISSAVFGIVLGGVCAGLFLLASATFGPPDEVESVLPLSWFSAMVISYIAIPFYRTIFEHKKPASDYPSLFEFAWNLPVIGAGSLAFIGVVWAVLGLWAALFSLIGIDFFEDIFFDEPFSQLATAGAGALGIGILRNQEGVVLALRGVLFALLKVLTPVVALMTAGFAVAAFVKGLDSLWEGWSATSLMVAAIMAAILFTNASIADKGRPQNLILRWSVLLQSIVLPVLAAFAVYGLWLRINEYGLTVERFYAALIVGVAATYSGVYALSALVPDQYRLWRMGNVAIAGALVVLAILVQTPGLNAYKISADNQVSRLQSGAETVESFDFGYLKWDLGKAGKQALKDLRDWEDAPDRDGLLAMLDELAAAEDEYEFRKDDKERENITAYNKALEDGTLYLRGFTPEEDFVRDALQEDALPYQFGINQCIGEMSCVIIKSDLLPGDEREFLFVNASYNEEWSSYNKEWSSVRLRFFRQEMNEDGRTIWKVMGDTEIRRFEDDEAVRAFMKGVVEGEVRTTTISLPAMQIGDAVFVPGVSQKLRDKLKGSSEDSEDNISEGGTLEEGEGGQE